MAKNKIFTIVISILISILIIYTLLGFFLTPKVLKKLIVENMNKNISQKASLEKIEFNPFSFELTINKFKILNKKDTTISIERIYANLDITDSLTKKNIFLKNLQIINPYIHIIENKDKSFNLQKILKQTKTKKKDESSNNNWKFQIAEAVIQKGKIKFTKLYENKNSYEAIVNNLNYKIYDLGTYKNSYSSHKLNFLINNHSKIQTNGLIKLEPFKTKGNIKLDKLKPQDFSSYFSELLNFKIDKDTNANVDFSYKVFSQKELLVDIQKLNLDLNKLDLIQKDDSILSLEKLKIGNLSFQYPKNILTAKNLNINGLKSKIISNEKGEINFSKLIKSQNNTEVKKEKETQISNNKLKIDLNNFDLDNSHFDYEDKKDGFNLSGKNINLSSNKILLENSNLGLEKINLKSKNINFENKNIELKVNNITLESNLFQKDEKNNISLKNLNFMNSSLAFSDKKTKKNINTEKTDLKIDTISRKEEILKISSIKLLEPNLSYEDELSKIKASVKNIDFLIDKITYGNDNLKIISSLLQKPKISVLLEKQTTKQKQNKNSTEKIEKNKKSENNFSYDIGPLNIKNAQLDFEDKNLAIPFKSTISNLHGKFSELNSSSLKPTKLNLEGTVNRYGYSKITGVVNLNNIKILTDTNILFKNIAIKNLNPYSIEFLGKEIQSGKLDLDLKYNITNSDLKAKNSIIISDIELGKNIPSKNATNLPLDLAVLLLENSKGIIDLKIPVTGNLDDPNFSLVPLVWKAFTNLILKAATSPFKILSSVFNFNDKDIRAIEFKFADSKILPSEKESLDNISKILKNKPKLAIKLNSTYHEKYDKLAIKNNKVNLLIKEKLKDLSDEKKYKTILEELYLKQSKEKNLTQLKEKYKDKAKEYLDYLKDFLIKKQKVSKKELEELAEKRSINIFNYLTKEKSLENKAVIIDKEIEVKNDNKVKWAIVDFKLTKRR